MPTHDDSELALALLATAILTSLLIGGFIFWLYWSDRKNRGSPKKPKSDSLTRKKSNADTKRRRPR